MDINDFYLNLDYRSSTMNLDERKFYYSIEGSIRSHEFYRDGKLEGERKSWHICGNPWEQEFYRNGLLEGERKIWHYNGQLIVTGIYKNGKMEGERKCWNSDGQIDTIGFYRDGEREGCHKFWRSDGFIYAHVIYRNGKVVKQCRYFPDIHVPAIDWRINSSLFGMAKTRRDFSFQKHQILFRLKTKLREIANLEKYQTLSPFLIIDLFDLNFPQF